MNQQNVIIWGALAVSQVIYLAVPAPPGGRCGEASGPISHRTWRRGSRRRYWNHGPAPDSRIQPYTRWSAWVLAESIAIYGLVLRFLHFELAYSLPFSVAGAGLLFFGRPWSPKLKKPLSPTELASSNAPLE